MKNRPRKGVAWARKKGCSPLMAALDAQGVTMKSHGYLRFSWEKNIFYVEVFGPFNEEGVIDEADRYLNEVLNRKVEYFSVIEVWDEEALGSPRAMHYVCKLWERLVEHNCISLALVVSNSVQRSISEKLLPNIGKSFQNKKDAEIWTLSRSGT